MIAALVYGSCYSLRHALQIIQNCAVPVLEELREYEYESYEPGII